ncbi:putative solute carrier family 22 member 31 isoform X1 [Ammospiza nelsoni]|uniref:putative solute carrier family 22 member 31 isoform X1 n=1 Tax=Ammospiza nelsoni TaxID=2857394 RepID=UPI002739F7B8|nr:putative solute carrier family 22 member 31 [Ammospiza caudacuta]XP_059337594.1 putative solute carrier family 22 member 31 isoform X1 [Ammospiza nelsoni]
MALRGSRPRGRRAAGGWAPCAALALGWALGWALGAEPPHRCRPDPALLPPPLRRLGGPALLRAAVPRLRGGWSPCQLYRYPPGSPRPNGTAPCTRGWHYALPAAGLRANLVTQWDLVCASRWKVPLEQTTHLLGWTLGSVTAGLACDRFGRRPTFLLSLALAVPVGLSVALAVDFLMVLVARLLFGAALAGAFLALYVARLELCDPPHRLGVTMVAGFFWMAGELLLPGLALLCRDWRVLQGAVTMILALLAASWWCPALLLEPPRWLLATRQLESARRSLQALAEDNCPQDSLVAELEALSEGPQRPRYHSVCEICGTRVIWKNGVILGFAAFIGSGIRHCFTRNLLPHLPHFFSSHLALLGTEAAACLFVCLTAERFGRRAILLLCTVLTGISSLLLLALTQYLLELIVLTLSVVGTAASHAVTMLSIFFASEVLPTVVRGAGLGLVLGANFVGKAAAPITAIPNSRGFFLHHVVFASFAILAVLSIMLLPESQGRALPQSLQDGESRRRPPLFRRAPREDHLPLLAPRALPHDYSQLAAPGRRTLRSPEPPREM